MPVLGCTQMVCADPCVPLTRTSCPIDVSVWTTVPDSGPLQSYVLIRPHDHPGDSPGPRTRGAAAHADEELRWLTDRDDD